MTDALEPFHKTGTESLVCTNQDLPSRPRRNRRSPSIREAISETSISPSNLILPVFIHDGEQNIPIGSMPGVDRLGWRHGLLDSVAEARSYGVNSVVLFPKVTLAHSHNNVLTWPMIAFQLIYLIFMYVTLPVPYRLPRS